jgi:hypothetical protein
MICTPKTTHEDARLLPTALLSLNQNCLCPLNQDLPITKKLARRINFSFSNINVRRIASTASNCTIAAPDTYEKKRQKSQFRIKQPQVDRIKRATSSILHQTAIK